MLVWVQHSRLAWPSFFAAGQEAALASGTDQSPSVRMAANFMATPLFAVVSSNNSGMATASFPAPEKLGSYIIRWVGVKPGGSACQCQWQRIGFPTFSQVAQILQCTLLLGHYLK